MAAPITPHTPATPCHWCRAPLLFVPGRGYAHPEGLYIQWCPGCHQEFSCHPPATCSAYCGSNKVRDRHCARPGLREGRRA